MREYLTAKCVQACAENPHQVVQASTLISEIEGNNGNESGARQTRNPEPGTAELFLFLLVTVLPEAFLPLVGSHLMTFALFSAWHKNCFNALILVSLFRPLACWFVGFEGFFNLRFHYRVIGNCCVCFQVHHHLC